MFVSSSISGKPCICGLERILVPSGQVPAICTHADSRNEAYVIHNCNQVAYFGILDAPINLTTLKSAKLRGYPILYVGRSHPGQSRPFNL